MALILVTGATGHIGNVLVHALSRRYPGETIRVFLQPRESLESFNRLTLQLYFGDIRKQDDVRAAVQGTRLVFHLAGVIDTSLNPGSRIYEINVPCCCNSDDHRAWYPLGVRIYFWKNPFSGSIFSEFFIHHLS